MDRFRVAEESWYRERSETWRPEAVRWLLIGESAPDAASGPERRRFFYWPHLTRHDNLFRAVIDALYDEQVGSVRSSKKPWLARLRDDGVFLIDLVPFPVNYLAPSARRQARRGGVPECLAAAAALAAERTVICQTASYKVLAEPLRRAAT